MGQDKLRPRRSVFSVCLQGLPREFLPIPIISKLRLSSPSSLLRPLLLRSLSKSPLPYFSPGFFSFISPMLSPSPPPLSHSSNARRIAISDCCSVIGESPLKMIFRRKGELLRVLGQISQKLHESLDFPISRRRGKATAGSFVTGRGRTRALGGKTRDSKIERLGRAVATACIIRPFLSPLPPPSLPFTTLRLRSFQILARLPLRSASLCSSFSHSSSLFSSYVARARRYTHTRAHTRAHKPTRKCIGLLHT